VILFARDANNLDSAYAVPMTNLGRNIQYHQYNPASGKIADVIQYKDAYYVYFHELSLPEPDGHALPKTPSALSFVDGGRKPAEAIASINNAAADAPAETAQNRIQLQTGDYFQPEFTQRNHPETGDSARVPPDEDARTFGEMLNIKAPVDTASTGLPPDAATSEDGYDDSSGTGPLASSTGRELRQQRVLYVD